MANGEMWVDATALGTVSVDLDDAASGVHTQAERLALTPDAGRSTDETARAVSALATTVAGLSEHLGTMVTSLEATIADYTASDARGQDRLAATATP